MKRLLLVVLIAFSGASICLGGGMVHNTNQSAAWIRMIVRDASTSIDAVFYNPAGLTKLADGFHFSLNSQTIKQKRTITNSTPGLSLGPKYEGETFVPVLPSVFAAYKTGKLAVSAGFFLVGGGGSAEFKKGLPSFDAMTGAIVPTLTAQLQPLDAGIEGATGLNPGYSNITGYSADIYFKGTSAYYGTQLGVSYAINDMFSLAVAGRYIMATNKYKGHLKNLQINTIADWQKPGDYFRWLATQPLIAAIGQTSTMTATGTYVDGQTADQEVDVTQKGTGFTPIIGANIALMDDRLNIGIKYEFATKMKVKNETSKDFVLARTADGTPTATLYPDGKETNSDIPGLFSIGGTYKISDALSASVGYHYYTDKAVSYGKTTDGVEMNNETFLDGNTYEIAVGTEYRINEKLLASVGYFHSQTQPKPIYNNDISHSLSASSVGFGVAYYFTPAISLDLGALLSFYEQREKTIDYGATSFLETYQRDSFVLAIGLNIGIFKSIQLD